MSDERRLIDVEALKIHRPRFHASYIVGCEGCGWTPYSFHPEWFEYINHLPQFGATGHLVLTRDDKEWLNKQNISVVSRDEPEPEK